LAGNGILAGKNPPDRHRWHQRDTGFNGGPDVSGAPVEVNGAGHCWKTKAAAVIGLASVLAPLGVVKLSYELRCSDRGDGKRRVNASRPVHDPLFCCFKLPGGKMPNLGRNKV